MTIETHQMAPWSSWCDGKSLEHLTSGVTKASSTMDENPIESCCNTKADNVVKTATGVVASISSSTQHASIPHMDCRVECYVRCALQMDSVDYVMFVFRFVYVIVD